MLLHRIVGVAGLGLLGLFALAATERLAAQEETKAKHPFLEALGKRIGLTAEQRDKLEKIRADYDMKEGLIEQRLRTTLHDEHEAMNKVLTDDQRAKVPEAMRQAQHHRWADFNRMLGLNREQQDRVEKIHHEYGPKYRKVMETKDAKPADFLRLRYQEFAAMGDELTDDQRARLPLVVQEAVERWHSPEFHQEQRKLFADKLGLSDEQKERVRKIHDEYAPKLKEPSDELRKLYKAEINAMEGTLTEAQRNKVGELRKAFRKGRE